MTYPFLLKHGKPFKIEADCFITALSKALMKHPGKRIIVKYSKAMRQYLANLNEKDSILVTRHGGITAVSLRDKNETDNVLPIEDDNMDLITAKKEAVTRSKADKKKTLHINVKEDGECEIEETPDATTHASYKAGKELPVDEPPTDTKVETVKSEVAVKTSTKTPSGKTKNSNDMKTVAKKVEKKVVAPKKAPAKSTPSDRVIRGNNMALSAAEWKKVDALLAKNQMTFSAWSRSLVLKQIK